MAIFNIQNQKLIPIKEREWPNEKHVQELTERNLEAVFDLQFVASEFSVQDFRIDTLAFDKETNAFVIIEYKRGKSSSVIDQGFSYLGAMLGHKANFILEYNENTEDNLTRQKVDWTQSRILFLSQSFTKYQQAATNFRDLPIELWEVQFYNNSTILYKQLLSFGAKESIKTITKDKTINEVKVYTVEDILEGKPDKVRNLFIGLQERILELGNDIEERPKKVYVSYRTSKAFAYIHFLKGKISIYLAMSQKELKDPRGISRDISKESNPDIS